MTAFVIIDVTEGDRFDAPSWPRRHGGLVIPEVRRPTILQGDREVADAEALRLAAAHPGRYFAVFEAVRVAYTVKAPTHVTLGGKVFAERDVPALSAACGPDGPDMLPF